jgi:hypothetical protein
VRLIDRLLPWILLLKALDILVMAPILLDNALLGALAPAALVVAALVWRRWPRPGAALAAIVLLVFAVGPLYRNHVAFLAWVAALWALGRDDAERRLLLTVHLSVVYAFATVVKLNPAWLSGAALEAREVVTLGVPVALLAWATVVVEGLLAVLVWRPQRRWLPLVLVVHIGFVVGMSDSVLELLRLIVFNAAIVTVWLALVAAAAEPTEASLFGPVSRPARAT